MHTQVSDLSEKFALQKNVTIDAAIDTFKLILASEVQWTQTKVIEDHVYSFFFVCFLGLTAKLNFNTSIKYII